MSTATSEPRIVRSPVPLPSLPPLENGDRLDQPTFHARYLAMPENVRAELIGGVVYTSSPVKMKHGEPHGHVTCWIAVYTASTPGLRMADNATAILGYDSELQADIALFTTGGQVTLTDDYIQGSPDFVCEISNTTESIDFNAKKIRL